MAMTTIRINEWELKRDGKLIPRIHFDPITIGGRLYGQLPCFSFWWLLERGLGVGADIFIDTRSPGRTPYISHVNFPTVPSLVQFCDCGKLFVCVGRHLQCMETEKKCRRRGIHAWLNDIPLDWINASLVYSPEMQIYVRDNPDYFRPRSC